jgi:hypothetical protein
VVAALLAACGQGNASQRTPQLAKLPLVRGSRVSVQVLRCDKGANGFCAWELVVIGNGYRSSEALLRSEHHRLLELGWSGANGDIGDEHAADSPGHKLRLTYATADGDLKGIDLGWIHRSRKVALALSQAIFSRAPTMSMLLELGAS